jgi:hypothetical protein
MGRSRPALDSLSSSDRCTTPFFICYQSSARLPSLRMVPAGVGPDGSWGGVFLVEVTRAGQVGRPCRSLCCGARGGHRLLFVLYQKTTHLWSLRMVPTCAGPDGWWVGFSSWTSRYGSPDPSGAGGKSDFHVLFPTPVSFPLPLFLFHLAVVAIRPSNFSPV